MPIQTSNGMYHVPYHESNQNAKCAAKLILLFTLHNIYSFQTISILDLKGLKISKLTGQIMDVVKHQSHVDALCFPEVGICSFSGQVQ
jgi:hypothetical protein